MGLKTVAIVPSAGVGKRFLQGASKPFVMLKDKPIIVWTIEVLQALDEISEIIPVIQNTCIDEFMDIADKYGLKKIKKIVPGGKERQDSVYNGLMSAPKDTELLLIHDGARPLVESGIIKKCVAELDGYDGAIVAVPLKDTVKEAGSDKIVIETPDRSRLWAVQTPQVFRYDVILKAYERARAEGRFSTDDSALVERYGGRVKLVMGSYRNIKITTPEDLDIAELLLGKEGI